MKVAYYDKYEAATALDGGPICVERANKCVSLASIIIFVAVLWCFFIEKLNTQYFGLMLGRS